MSIRFSNPEQWLLAISPESYDLIGHRTFSDASCSRRPKIYLFSHEGEIVYVGITRRMINQRLRDGFKASGKNGYHGYAFRKPDAIAEYGGHLMLHVWAQEDPQASVCDEGRPIVNADGSPRWASLDVEKIEAEIVHLIRKETDQWPLYQTEIHFSETSEEHRAMARQIFTHVTLDSSINA